MEKTMIQTGAGLGMSSALAVGAEDAGLGSNPLSFRALVFPTEFTLRLGKESPVHLRLSPEVLLESPRVTGNVFRGRAGLVLAKGVGFDNLGLEGHVGVTMDSASSLVAGASLSGMDYTRVMFPGVALDYEYNSDLRSHALFLSLRWAIPWELM